MLLSDSETKHLGNNSISVTVVSLLFYLATAIFAMLTMLTHIAQIAHLPFKLYFGVALGICVGVVTFWFMIFKIQMARINIRDIKNLLFLLSLGLVGSIISLIANRPDADDYYYIPNAVFYTQNPNTLMGFEVHYLFSSTPLASFAWATSNAYEYIQALIAFGFRIDFLSVYYLLMPAIAGFMIPLAFFLAIIHFSDNVRSAIAGTLITVCVLLLLGETHRTFGNFSFVRIFQGKSILLSLGIPLFIAFSIDYFAKPSPLTWAGLFFVATALVGTSSTTAFILPALSSILSLAYIVSIKKYKFQIVAGYFTSLLYVIMIALYIFIFWRTGIDNTSPANQNWPTTFLGHAEFFINYKTPLTPLLTIGSTFLAILLLKEKQRKFLVVWTVVSIGVFLNPITSSFLIEHITSANVYWRMFYVYPFPLVVGILSSAVFTQTRRLSPTKQFSLALFTSIILLGAICLSPTSVFRQQSIHVGAPTYKLPINAFKQAKEITAIAPAGVMLAPAPIGGLIAIIDSRFPQIRIREDAELTWLHKNDANLRIAASDYVGGQGNDLLSFQGLISLYNNNIHSIVIQKIVLNKNIDCKNLLIMFGFTNQKDIGEYVVFWKP